VISGTFWDSAGSLEPTKSPENMYRFVHGHFRLYMGEIVGELLAANHERFETGHRCGARASRRAKKAALWIARRYVGAGAYETEQIGLADDGREADGKQVLTFAQAQARARRWAT
jgi:hypothetical protein